MFIPKSCKQGFALFAGFRFNIISYKEELLFDAIGRYTILRLSKDQFDQLSRMLREPTIKLKRIGVDDKPFKLSFGGGMYWSQHSDHEDVSLILSFEYFLFFI
jgi:hypothetical protein